MNSILFEDAKGQQVALSLRGFIYRGHFYGTSNSRFGMQQTCIPFSTYLGLLRQ